MIVAIQKYPGDEILLVYDRDFKYGENFYVCITEEAKELVLNVSVSFRASKLQNAKSVENFKAISVLCSASNILHERLKFSNPFYPY